MDRDSDVAPQTGGHDTRPGERFAPLGFLVLGERYAVPSTQRPEDRFAYSSLAAGRPGTPSEGQIYLLYEGRGGGRIARLNLAWLLEGEKTGEGEVPELK